MPARTDSRARACARGGYILREASGGKPQLILIATGSELQLAFAAAETLEGEGIASRVVSLPCWERFDAQDQAYRDDVLPPSVRKRVSVEVGVSLGWERWVGDEGAIIGLDHFGASAPAGTIFEKFGFTADRVDRRRPARRARRPARPHPDRRWRPLREASDDRQRRSGRRPERRVGPRPQLMRVAFSADHAGAAFKDDLIRRLAAADLGHELIDLGGDGSDPTDDYPDFAQRLGQAIQDGAADRGILICGSGVGASVAANKMRGIRAAVCHDTYSAHQGVEHDDMNVLTLGARVIGPEPGFECAVAFLGATFSGEPRHRRRLAKVLAMEAAAQDS